MLYFKKLLLFFIPLCSGLLGDYLDSTPMGPGIIHHHEYRSAGPWHLHILEIDLSDSLNTLETVRAQNRVSGFERTSSMSARSDHPEHRIVGAINGDFYDGSGVTIGAQIVQGNLVKRPYPRSVFAMTAAKQPLIEIVNYYGQMIKGDSLILEINGINEDRLENQLVYYNHFRGNHTGTNQWGTEISLQYLQDLQGANAPVLAVVTAKDSSMGAGSGNMAIPVNMGAVISGHGLARDFLDDSIFIGDTVVVQLILHPTNSATLPELIGGTPRIIRDGVRSVEYEEESVSYSFAHDRHPRTAVGYSADSARVYFFTVDGRQAGYSVGMSLYELADYMLEWDIFQGLNLDGGGSTTMVVRGNVENSPSDAGGERSVANSLMAVSLAPLGPLAYLNLPWEETYTLVETQLQFTVTAADAFYNPLPVSNDTLVWVCDPQVGTISATGLFTAATEEGQGFVWVSSNNIIDSALAHVTDIATLILEPDPVILEVGEYQQLWAIAQDSFGHLLQVEPESYIWWVSPELASISASGQVYAENIGEGSIEASFHGVTGSVPLVVGASLELVLDDFSDTDNYTLSGVRIDLDACAFTPDTSYFVSPPASGRLDYSLTTGGTSVLYLNCNIPVSGTPESVSIQVYGDNSAHWLRGEFENILGDKFLIDFTTSSPGIDWDNEWRELTVLLSEATPHWANPDAILSFPISWKKIYLAETDDNNKDSGTIFLDDFVINYIISGLTPTPTGRPENFNLQHQYPNPFNASTSFRFNIYASGVLEMRIFGLNGQEVQHFEYAAKPGNLTMTWEPGNLSSGVYLFQTTLNQQQLSGKCLLLK